MICVVVIGLGILIGLAAMIGNQQAQEHAWRRIATERRLISEKSRELQETALALQAEKIEIDRRRQRIQHRERDLVERESTIERCERELRANAGAADLADSE
jgi:uncharacterized protein (DUF3084 family)